MPSTDSIPVLSLRFSVLVSVSFSVLGSQFQKERRRALPSCVRAGATVSQAQVLYPTAGWCRPQPSCADGSAAQLLLGCRQNCTQPRDMSLGEYPTRLAFHIPRFEGQASPALVNYLNDALSPTRQAECSRKNREPAAPLQFSKSPHYFVASAFAASSPRGENFLPPGNFTQRLRAVAVVLYHRRVARRGRLSRPYELGPWRRFSLADATPRPVRRRPLNLVVAGAASLRYGECSCTCRDPCLPQMHLLPAARPAQNRLFEAFIRTPSLLSELMSGIVLAAWLHPAAGPLAFPAVGYNAAVGFKTKGPAARPRALAPGIVLIWPPTELRGVP